MSKKQPREPAPHRLMGQAVNSAIERNLPRSVTQFKRQLAPEAFKVLAKLIVDSVVEDTDLDEEVLSKFASL